jgi:hypothetical protein
MENLKRRFLKALNSYSSLRNSSESKVTRWEWASGPVYALQPFWFERMEIAKGRLTKTKPKDEGYQYGFDSEGRIVVSRAVEGSKTTNEEFFSYLDSMAESVSFGNSPKAREVNNVGRFDFKNGLLTQAESYGASGVDRETYHYQVGRLVAVDVFQHEHGLDPETFSFQLDYDDTGGLQAIRVVSSDSISRMVYKAPESSKIPAKLLSNKIKQELLIAIPQIIANAKIQGPAYCLLLAYNPGSWFPPSLAIGMESEREARIQSLGLTKAKAYLWNPATFHWFDLPKLEFVDSLSSLYRDINKTFKNKKGDAAARKLLNETAAELIKFDWRGKLKTSNDFVVVAVDLEGADLRQNFRASVSADKRRTLNAAGYL